MMILIRTAFLVASSFLLSKRCTAVPVIVWNKAGNNDVQFTTEEIVLSQFVASLDVSSKNEISVLFLLERNDTTGSESLTSMAPFLSKSQQQSIPVTQHLHVSGVGSGTVVLNVVKKAQPEASSLLINLNEWAWKLNSTHAKEDRDTVEMDSAGGFVLSKSEVKHSKRIGAIDAASCFVVQLPSDIPVPSLDATIAQALVHPSVSTVVLSSVRGIDEVKYERELTMRRKLQQQTIMVMNQPSASDPAHRRLQNEEDAEDNASNDLTGVYYVQLTPNILAGLLFFFLFATVAMIGLSCMNMIAGQDVYVHTMPSIGREA